MPEQKKIVIINPHFKGLVNYPSATAATVVTGNIGCGEGFRQATKEEYIDSVRRCAEECPELAQTLARTVAAAILAYELVSVGVDVRLVSVEGCMHRIGPFEARGSEIVSTIWSDVVFRRYSEVEQSFQSVSCCTVEESRLIIAEAMVGTRAAQVQCVTHEYHKKRVDWTLRAALRRARAEQQVELWPTMTPEEVLEQSGDGEQRYRFLREIILASQITPGRLEAEFRAEFPIRVLYCLSSFIERLTFGAVNIETWLASRRRNRLKT